MTSEHEASEGEAGERRDARFWEGLLAALLAGVAVSAVLVWLWWRHHAG
jgi:hypothetical protein